MSPPKYSSRYPEISGVLDYALAHGGARYTLTSGGKATHWRQRAYLFRKILWKELNANHPVPPLPTPYDGLRLTVDPADPATVVIEINSPERVGTLTPLGAPNAEEQGELFNEMVVFRTKLFGD